MQYIGLIGWLILLTILGISINPAWSTILVVVVGAAAGLYDGIRKNKKEQEKRRRREEMRRRKLDYNFDPVF